MGDPVRRPEGLADYRREIDNMGTGGSIGAVSAIGPDGSDRAWR